MNVAEKTDTSILLEDCPFTCKAANDEEITSRTDNSILIESFEVERLINSKEESVNNTDNSILLDLPPSGNKTDNSVLVEFSPVEENPSVVPVASDLSFDEMEPLYTSTPSNGAEVQENVQTSGSTCRRQQLHRTSRYLSFQRKPNEILGKDCCTKSCLKKLSVEDIEEAEDQLRRRGESQQVQYILDVIWMHSQSIHASGCRRPNVVHKLVLNGRRVCPEAWRNAHNCSKKRFNKCAALFKAGIRNRTHGNKGRKTMGSKGRETLCWMKFVFPRIGDFMPHKTQVHLPVKYTKRALWKRMIKELRERDGGLNIPVVSFPHFVALWLKHLPNFVIPKRSEFTVCGDCTSISSTIQSVRTEAERIKLQEVWNIHLNQVEKERSAYHEAQEVARRSPDDLTVLAIDGMDQSKTDVPKLTKKDKDTVHLARVPVHVTGVLLHTRTTGGKVQMTYTDTKHIPHDSNLTMNIMLDVLVRHRNKLGKRLFVQLDNCYRENKNRFLLSFCSLLIDLNVFEEIEVHFLPVGHTHIDVDQLFSRISVKILKSGDIYTLEELYKVIAEASTPAVEVIPLPPIFDIKGWITPHFYGKMGNHSKPHWFRFQKVNGTTLMQYKMWVDDVWSPGGDNAEGLRCLKTIPELAQVPEWVKPSIEKMEPEALRNDFEKGYARMPEEARTWWEIFLPNMEKLEQVPNKPDQWALQELANNLSKFSDQPVCLPLFVQEIENKLNAPCPQVFVGSQGRDHIIEEVDDVASHLTVGQIVAIHLDGEKGPPPFLGMVHDVSAAQNGTVIIQWLKGGWRSAWKPLSTGRGRNSKPYCQSVPVSAIILFSVTLNAVGCLTTESVRNLKARYKEVMDGE